MRKQLILRGLAAAVLLCAAAVPVLAALEGDLDYSAQSRVILALNDNISSLDAREPDCGPVYVPTLVHERDGSIVGMAYVPDGDNC